MPILRMAAPITLDIPRLARRLLLSIDRPGGLLVTQRHEIRECLQWIDRQTSRPLGVPHLENSPVPPNDGDLAHAVDAGCPACEGFNFEMLVQVTEATKLLGFTRDDGGHFQPILSESTEIRTADTPDPRYRCIDCDHVFHEPIIVEPLPDEEVTT